MRGSRGRVPIELGLLARVRRPETFRRGILGLKQERGTGGGDDPPPPAETFRGRPYYTGADLGIL